MWHWLWEISFIQGTVCNFHHHHNPCVWSVICPMCNIWYMCRYKSKEMKSFTQNCLNYKSDAARGGGGYFSVEKLWNHWFCLIIYHTLSLFSVFPTVQPPDGHDKAPARVWSAAHPWDDEGNAGHHGADCATPRGSPSPNTLHRDGDAATAAQTPGTGENNNKCTVLQVQWNPVLRLPQEIKPLQNYWWMKSCKLAVYMFCFKLRSTTTAKELWQLRPSVMGDLIQCVRAPLYINKFSVTMLPLLRTL